MTSFLQSGFYTKQPQAYIQKSRPTNADISQDHVHMGLIINYCIIFLFHQWAGYIQLGQKMQNMIGNMGTICQITDELGKALTITREAMYA